MPDWTRLSQTERDASYDNNKAVANSSALIEKRNALSAAFRASHADHLDISYGRGERQKFDLYPGKNAAVPCLVFIHGGYWQRNRREDFAAFAAGVMAHGWSVAMPGYSLAPDVSLTAIVAEIAASLKFLSAEGPALGLAAGPIIVAGWSAGAHLAVMALDHPVVNAGCAISGVYNLAPIRDTYLNDKLQLNDNEIARLSPLTLPPVSKPLAIAYGTAELWPLVADAQMLHKNRSAAHLPGTLLPVAGANHFTILEGLYSPDSALTRHVLTLPESQW